MGRNEQRGVRSCIESQVDNTDGKGRLLPHPPDLRQQPGSLEQRPGRLLLLPVGHPAAGPVQQVQGQIRACLPQSYGPISLPILFT